MKDLLSGILFISVGAAFLYASVQYPMGEVDQLGPGFWPTVISILLIATGCIVIANKK